MRRKNKKLSDLIDEADAEYEMLKEERQANIFIEYEMIKTINATVSLYLHNLEELRKRLFG